MFCMGVTDNDSTNQHQDTFLVLLLDENKIHVLCMSFTPVQNTSQKLHHTSGQNTVNSKFISSQKHTIFFFSLSSRSNSETHNSQMELTIILCVVEDSLRPMIHFACRPSPSVNNQTAIGRQLP